MSRPTGAALRIAVVGPMGAGKTVLAGRLSRRLRVPHLCLDELYWERGWQPVEPDLFLDRVREALAPPRWLAEGVHGGGAADLLWDRAHLVVWLDLPRWLCLLRVSRRAVDNIVHRRLLWGKNIDSWRRFLSRDSIGLIAFRHYRSGQEEIRDRLTGTSVAVVRLRSRRAVTAWLARAEAEGVRVARAPDGRRG